MTPPTSPETADIETIAGRLTKGVKRALLRMRDSWQAGPDMSRGALDHIRSMHERGLVERKFADVDPPSLNADAEGVTLHLRACWWFRLTPLGIAVAAHLRSGDPQ